MMTDPIADMLTRIRNANTMSKRSTEMPASKIKVGIAQILQEEGFIDSYSVKPGKPSSTLEIRFKYGPDGEKVIRHIQRISRPGCRVYKGAKEVPEVLRGLGIHIMSTPRGILSDRTARKTGTGGEILCKVY